MDKEFKAYEMDKEFYFDCNILGGFNAWIWPDDEFKPFDADEMPPSGVWPYVN